MRPKFFKHDIPLEPKAYLQFLNATLDCDSTDTADRWTDGGASEGLGHCFTFLALCVGDGAPSDGALGEHWHREKTESQPFLNLNSPDSKCHICETLYKDCYLC